MTTLLLGLALLVVGGLGVALLELLIRRADVAAANSWGGSGGRPATGSSTAGAHGIPIPARFTVSSVYAPFR